MAYGETNGHVNDALMPQVNCTGQGRDGNMFEVHLFQIG